MPEPPAPLRAMLRAATQDSHHRLHGHDGFAAIQSATIDRASYRKMLVRLYGFYAPFEAEAALGRERTNWLEADLRTLGVVGAPASPDFEMLPKCPAIPCLDNPERRLGALYVAEGAALGGRQLQRGLDPLLGAHGTAGRRFFAGNGSSTGPNWRHYLARLSAASEEPAARARIVGAAVETFAVFEDWLTGWAAGHG